MNGCMLKWGGCAILVLLCCILSVGCVGDGNVSPDGMPSEDYQDQFDAMRDYYDTQVVIYPEDPEAWCQRAMYYSSYEQYAAAMESCEKALELDPEYGLAWLVKGIILTDLDRHCESLPCFENAKKYDPELTSNANAGYAYGKEACLL